MTYCVGVMLDEGLVFASDSRTNAGVDNISKFCKMTVFEYRGDRVIVLLSSGNLAGTQAVIGLLDKRCDAGSNTPSLWNARVMFDAARLVANAMRDIERRDGVYLEPSDISFNASFITGLDWGEAPGGSQMSLPTILRLRSHCRLLQPLLQPFARHIGGDRQYDCRRKQCRPGPQGAADVGVTDDHGG